MKKIAFIENTWNNTKNKEYSGVGYYRLVCPSKYIKNYQIDVIGKEIKEWGTELADVFGRLFREYDAVVTKAIDNPQAASALCFMANHYSKPLIIDLDDNYFEVRPDQPGYKWYYPGSQKSAILSAYLSLATHMVVSTQPLADYFTGWYKKKEVNIVPDVLPNYHDFSEFNYKYKGNTDKKRVVIGWQGSTTHLSDLKLVMPALEKLMIKYPFLHVEFMGGLEKEQVQQLFAGIDLNILNRIEVTGGTPSWKEYPKKLSKTKWDIGICPLIDDEFNRNKSHIKWMEYSTYKIPTVASMVYPYYKKIDGVDAIKDGKTGFLANDTKDWVEKLSKLIENKELREEIGNNAYNYIKDNLTIQDNIYKWEKVFDKILK